METELLEVRTCLQLVLESVDYLLPDELAERSRKALAATQLEPEAWQTKPPLAILIDEKEADSGN